MSILSSTGKIVMVKEPVCGRFGIHRLMAMLTSNSLKISWNGIDEITVVTFHKRRPACKLLHIDVYGIDCTTRILNSGRFQVMLSENQIPVNLTRQELEQLLREGTVQDNKLIYKAA